MTYSVWNDATRRYDYYQTPATTPIHAGSPAHVRGARGLGATPEQAAWPLPAGAVRVGTGDRARGRVARNGGGLALGAFAATNIPTYFKAAALIAVVLVVGKYAGRRR